jgi:adenosylcobinamide kinase/adenosylcobinamide-phosphate guanylyltransferase
MNGDKPDEMPPAPGFRLALVLGGARSGKSRYGLSLAEKFPAPRLFVATCEPGDPEMCARIDHHRKERGPQWETKETPLDLSGTLAAARDGYGVILIDCLTMWLSNLMQRERGQESGVRAELDRLEQSLLRPPAPTILISNEVGSGIVPENALAREFRDWAGLLHQRLARAADLVVLVVAGIPLVIKVGDLSGDEPD